MGRASRLVPLVLAAVAYLYVFPYQPVINNPNENVRFYMTVAVVDHGTFAIDEVERTWGWVNDKARRGEHVYSVKAPGTSYLGIPAYAGYKLFCLVTGHGRDRTEALWVCRVFASILPSLVFLAFFRRFLIGHDASRVSSRAAVLAVAFGSAFHAYALLFVSHTLAACAAFAALGLLARLDSRGGPGTSERPWLAAWAGSFAAAVTAFEYPGLVATLVLSGYAVLALRPRTRLLWFAGGAAVPTLLVMLFQWRAFGSPFTPGHRYLDNPAYLALAREGFFGASRFHPEALGLLGDPAYGLFLLTPFLVAAPVGFWVLVASTRHRRPAIAALLVTLGTIAAICFMNNWRGGWTVGPRYLVTLVPFVAWAAAAGWDALARWLPRAVPGIAIGLGAAGLVASGIPSSLYPHVPEAFTRPLPQLFAVLVSHGYAPYTLGALLGLGARASLVPLAAIGLFAAVWPMGGVAGWRRRVIVGVVALVACGCALVPILHGPEASPAARRMLAHVTRSWRPDGRDDAALLRARLGVVRDDTGGWRRLADLYREEGRDREARRAQRRARTE